MKPTVEDFKKIERALRSSRASTIEPQGGRIMKECCELYHSNKINIPGIGEVNIEYNFCPDCGERLERYSKDEIVAALERIMKIFGSDPLGVAFTKYAKDETYYAIRYHLNQLKGDQ